MSINNYLESYGEPDAVIFSFNKNNYYMIWGFDDTFSIDMNEISADSLINLQSKIDDWKKNSDEIAAVGYLSYDSKNIFFPKLNFKESASSEPVVWFGKPKKIKLVSKKNISTSSKPMLEKIKSIDGIETYNKIIKTIKEYLKDGDVYQINYTQPEEYAMKSTSEFKLFLKLFNFAQPDFGAYLSVNDMQIISLSPENFITKTGPNISSFPIKGTRQTSKDPIENQVLIDELKNSVKDKAEHVMIVDLIRNDLGKICKYGSVNTVGLFNVVSYKTIQHMVTEIKGKQRDNINETDILTALFPGGSITGAPKQRAIEIIDEIESYSRGIYTGSMGLITSSGDMIFNIAIRTLTLRNSIGVYPVGGGIVWDSDATEERKEALNKSRVLEQ